MSQFVKYITKQEERFDQIAFNVYGDSGRWKDIIDANPTLPLQPNYAAGIVIRVPIITLADSELTQNLPPWKS